VITPQPTPLTFLIHCTKSDEIRMHRGACGTHQKKAVNVTNALTRSLRRATNDQRTTIEVQHEGRNLGGWVRNSYF
jgi:hypothetical protein